MDPIQADEAGHIPGVEERRPQVKHKAAERLRRLAHSIGIPLMPAVDVMYVHQIAEDTLSVPAPADPPEITLRLERRRDDRDRPQCARGGFLNEPPQCRPELRQRCLPVMKY